MNDDEFYEEDSLDSLRTEVNQVSTAVSRGYLNHTDGSIADTGIRVIYEEIAKRHNLTISYKDFDSFIKDIGKESKFDSRLNEAIGSKVVGSIAKRVQLKLMYSMSSLVDTALSLIEKESRTTSELSPELIGMIDKAFLWYQSLQSIQDEIKITDSDKAIERAIANDRRENPEKYLDGDVDSRSAAEIGEQNYDEIRRIMKTMN